MDNRDLELLQAIQLIIDPLKDDMKDVKDRLGNVEGRLGNVEGRLTNVEEETRRTSLIIENSIEPRLQALHEGYMPLVEKVRYVPEEIAELKEDVSILKYVQKQMADKIKNKLGV